MEDEDYPNYGGDFEDEDQEEELNPERVPEEGMDHVPITGLTEDQINEWRYDDEKSYMANVAREIRAELAQEAKTNTLDDYIEKNPDLEDMWKKGEIQEYMEKHPEDDVIASYKQLANRTPSQEHSDMVGRISKNIQEARKSK